MSKPAPAQTTTSQTKLPKWVEDAAKKNLAQSYEVANNLAGPYTGERVAGMTPGQLSTIDALQGNVGSTNGAFAAAGNAASGVAGYQPDKVSAETLANTDLAPYMNPFTNNVINSSLRNLNIQTQQGMNSIGDSAIRNGAFGSSRHGVAEAVLGAESARQAGDLTANLQSQNFLQAQNAAVGDISRGLQTGLANQQAGLQGAGLRLAGANAMGDLASRGQSAFLTGSSAALAGQEALQGQKQKELLARQQLYNEWRNLPLEKLQIPLQALGATPYGSSTTQTTSGATQNLGMSALGGAATGASLAGTLGMSSGMGAGIGALLPLLAMSDRDEKTNIQKIGTDPTTGVPIYAYDYKADVAEAKRKGTPMPPKRVGPMAQDIEKVSPGSVGTVGGKKVISLGFGG